MGWEDVEYGKHPTRKADEATQGSLTKTCTRQGAVAGVHVTDTTTVREKVS